MLALSDQEIMLLYGKKQRLKITNTELGKAVGLSAGTISRYFNFRMKLTHDNEIKIKRYIEDEATKKEVKSLLRRT